MLFRNFALAAAAAFAPTRAADDDKGQSIFVTDDQALAFAFTVPPNSDQLAFSLRVKRSYSWGAVGIGSNDMRGALYFMIYETYDRDNVTFSPRVSYGNIEPHYFDEVKWEVIDAGVDDDYMFFTAKCLEHCRSWPSAGTGSGYIDVSSSRSEAIFALGPKEAFGSDKIDQALKMHSRYGGFTLDMKRAQGVKEEPELKGDVKAVGSDEVFSKSGVSDIKSTIHAVLMIFAICAMMPIGALLLRLGGWVRWHALNQTVAMVLVLTGFGLGIATSFTYQRSRGFTSYHQIVGIIVVAFVLAQFSFGFLHHRKFKEAQNPTIFGKIHVWMGRFILFLGTLNAFFGLTFALNRRYGMILAGLIIFIILAVFAGTVGRRWLAKNKRMPGGPPGGQPQYNSQPWRQPPPQGHMGGGAGGGYPSEPPPGYAPPSQQDSVGLRSVSPSPWRSASERKDEEDDTPHLGSAQTPREFT